MRHFVIGHNNSKYKIYEFRPFDELLSTPETDENKLFDIIGDVAKDTVRTKNISGRTTRMIDIVLEDLEHKRLSCMLWGDYADEVGTILESGEVRVCNTYHVIKVTVNAEVEEVKEFRNKLITGNETVSQRISQISTSSIYNISDDLAIGACEVKTIDQLFESLEVSNCWVFVTIVAIESDQD